MRTDYSRWRLCNRGFWCHAAMIPRPAPAETKRALSAHSAKASSAARHLRNDPGSLDDLNVIGPDGKDHGPHFEAVRPRGLAVEPVRRRPAAAAEQPSREEAQAAFRETWERWLAPTQPR